MPLPPNSGPPYDTKVSKFPLPGALPINRPGVVICKPDAEPMEFLIQVMHDPQQNWDRRVEAAKALLPFCHTIKPAKRS
jgi:hypothetical protein